MRNTASYTTNTNSITNTTTTTNNITNTASNNNSNINNITDTLAAIPSPADAGICRRRPPLASGFARFQVAHEASATVRQTMSRYDITTFLIDSN
jgi:hypothetical protein